MTTDKKTKESTCNLIISLRLSKSRDLKRDSEWDLGSAKDMILIIAFFWITYRGDKNEGKV